MIVSSIKGLLLAASLTGLFNTDLSSLIGGDAEVVTMARAHSSEIRVLCDTPEAAQACESVASDFNDGVDARSMYELLCKKGQGILSEKARLRLASGEGAKIKKEALKRRFSSIDIFPEEVDPYFFITDFVFELKASQSELPEGARILYKSVDERDGEVLDKLMELAKSREDIHISGSPFHSRIATAKTKKEINALGTIAALLSFLIGMILFRSAKFLLPMISTMATGFAAAILAIFLLPGKPHLITLLFGTSLIGLGVDYCFHGFTHRGRAREMFIALLTTSLAFASLLFSGIDALRQMAVFTIVGLGAIYFMVTKVFSSLEFNEPRRIPIRFSRLYYLPALAIFLISLWRPLEIGNSLKDLYTPDDFLAANEEAFAASQKDAQLGFKVVDLEAWQKENIELKAAMGEKESEAELITGEELPSLMRLNVNGRDKLLLPGERTIRGEMEQLLDNFMSRAITLLIVAVLMLSTVIFAVYKKQAIRIVFPVVFSLFMTFFTLKALGERINFFHLLSLFIVMGLGIDYAVFHRADNQSAVFCSFLSSLFGFGMLALTSFPATRSMGMVIAIGLIYMYFFSLPRKSSERANGENLPWHRQREQSAGVFRIAVLWYLYRFLGKSAAKILFTPVFAIFIYPFCRAGRMALRDFSVKTGLKLSAFKTMLSFAWSVFDKTDACTLNKNPPKMKLEGDLDWMKGGCFLLSTHIGCIEVLPALLKQLPPSLNTHTSNFNASPKVNAFQQLSHDSIFTSIFLKYMNKDQFKLHAVEDIGVETAANMEEAIKRGEIVLMAADRPSAGSSASIKAKFFNHSVAWPKGVFRFAKLMNAPVFAISAVRTSRNEYTVITKKLDIDELTKGYVAYLEDLARSYPEQWYNFYPFFEAERD